jgi:hypothetical protein
MRGKKLSGPLAAPIDTGVIVPLPREDLCELHRAKFAEKQIAELRRQRMAKMPDLARHLDIKFEHLDLTKPADMVLLCADIGLNLAVLLIPGFQENGAAREWPDNLVFDILVDIEKLKNHGAIKSDFEGCIRYLTKKDPKLARPHRETELAKKAKTLQNRIAARRASLRGPFK